MATISTRRSAAEAEPQQADDIRQSSRPTEGTADEIAHRAYERYEERGRQHGHDVDDWLQAESDVRQRPQAST
jgi:Protein of unknown function (DUF2934)